MVKSKIQLTGKDINCWFINHTDDLPTSAGILQIIHILMQYDGGWIGAVYYADTELCVYVSIFNNDGTERGTASTRLVRRATKQDIEKFAPKVEEVTP